MASLSQITHISRRTPEMQTVAPQTLELVNSFVNPQTMRTALRRKGFPIRWKAHPSNCPCSKICASSALARGQRPGLACQKPTSPPEVRQLVAYPPFKL